jgi:S-adenosylmethionine synthetase
VDRSAAYAARWVAKNVVAAGLATKAEVQVAYAIGVAKPVSISVNVDSYGTGKLDDAKLTQLVEENFDLTPRAIIETLDLRRPIYLPTAAYGHFGRHGDSFTWERTDMAEKLREAAGKL